MATVEWSSSGSVSGKLVVTWAALTANDSGEPVLPQGPRPLAGAVQFRGTFGGAVTLQKSNDGVTWFTVKDFDGVDIAPTAAAFYEFSTSAMQLRVLVAAAVSAVDVIMVLRG